MIQKLVLSALLLGTASANAQTKTMELRRLKPKQQKHFNLINSIIQNNPRNNSVAHKPTAIKQRVVAQVVAGDGYYDSLSYHYSGTNGSQYNFNNLSELGYSPRFKPNVSPAYEDIFEVPSNDIKADSINRYSEDEHEAREIAFYNSAGLLDSSYSEWLTTMDFEGSYTMKYNDNGQVTSFKQWELWSDSPWGLWRRITHNPSGQVLTDSFFYFTEGEWTHTISNRYIYNALGLLDTFIEAYGIYTFLYDAAGRVTTSKYFEEDDGTLVQQDETTIGYTEGANYFTSYQYVVTMGPLSDNYKVVQYPGTHPGPDSFKIFARAGSSWVETTKADFTYNDFGNPTLISARGEELEGDLIMYYQDYDDGLSNKDIVINKDFSVYPNPFKDNIVIENSGKLQRLHVSLTDISGKLLYNEQISLGNGINNLPLPQIPAGNYLLRLEDATGKGWSQKMVKK